MFCDFSAKSEKKRKFAKMSQNRGHSARGAFPYWKFGYFRAIFSFFFIFAAFFRFLRFFAIFCDFCDFSEILQFSQISALRGWGAASAGGGAYANFKWFLILLFNRKINFNLLVVSMKRWVLVLSFRIFFFVRRFTNLWCILKFEIYSVFIRIQNNHLWDRRIN